MKKLIQMAFLLGILPYMNAQFQDHPWAAPTDAGVIGPANEIWVMDASNTFQLTDEQLGYHENAVDVGFVAFYCWQRSFNGTTWEIVTEFPDQTQAWPGNFPYGGLPNPENMIYYNPTYTVPSSDMHAGWGSAYYRRVCWNGGTNYWPNSNYNAKYSNTIRINFWDNMDAGSIIDNQVITDGRNPSPINNNAYARMTNGTVGAMSYKWQRSTDGNVWADVTAMPSSWPNNLYTYTPPNDKGLFYYRRAAYNYYYQDPQQAGYSNTISIHNVYITSPGTIRENPSSCDIRYVNFVEDSPLVFSGNGNIPCDYIHGYELSYNNGSTWESTQIASGSSFDVDIPFGNAFLIRRWVQDPYDQIGGVKQYSNTITISASAPGEIVDASVNLCEGNTYAYRINNVSNGSYHGQPVSYQWSVSTNNSVFVDIPGETGTSLVYSPGSYNEYLFFQRKMYLTGCSDFYSLKSNTVEVHKPRQINGGIITSTDNVYCYNETMQPLNVLNVNGTRNVRYAWTCRPVDQSEDWQAMVRVVNFVDGSTENLNIKTMRRRFWDWSVANGGVEFRRYVYSVDYPACNSYSENTYSISTYPEIQPGIIGDNEIICSSFNINELPEIQQMASPRGGDGNYIYSWEYQNSGETTWNTIPGANGTQLTLTELPTTSRTYRRNDHDGCQTEGLSKYTNEIVHTFRNPSIEGVINNIEECDGELVTVNAPSGYEAYHWNLNNSAFISGGTEYTKRINESDISLALRTTDSDGCEAETEVSIEAFSIPTFTMPNVHICEGENEIIVAPEEYVQYSFDGNPLTTNNTISLNYNDATLNPNRNVSVVDVNGCNSDDISYTATPERLPNINLTNDYICYGESHTISITADPTYRNITWEDNNGVISSGPSNYSITVNPTVTTDYTVTVENNYCSTSSTMTLTVRNNPEIELRDTFACYMDDLLLTAEDSYPFHYWSTNNGFEGGVTQIQVRNNLSVSLRVVDEYSCETTENMSITMQALPVVSISTVEGCVGDSVILSAPAGYVRYLWENGDTDRETQMLVMQSGHPDNTVEVTVTNEYGCSSTTNANIYPLPSPDPPGILTQYACEGEDLLISSTRDYSGYYWSTGETTRSITVNFIEDASLYLKVNNEFGCYDSTIFDVIVNEAPDFNINDTSKCNDGSSFAISSPITSDNYDYYWSNGSIGENAQFTLGSSSQLWLEITDGLCSYRDFFTVEVLDIPVVNLPDTNICVGDSLIYTYPVEYENYSWSNGNTGPTLRTLVNSNQVHSLTVIDNHGCIGRDNMTVNRLNLPTVFISSESSICAGSDASLSVASSFPEILWSTGETSASIRHTLYTDSLFSVTVRDINGCQASDATTVETTPIPVGQLSDTTICEGEYAILSQPGNYLLNWSTGATGNNILFRPSNSVRIYLTITDQNDCVGYDSMNIELIEIPNIVIPNESVCDGDSVRLESPIEFESMLWSNGDTTLYTYISPTNQTEMITFNYADQFGCSGSTNTIVTRLQVTPFSIAPQAICMGESAVLSAQIGFDSYSWSTGETTHTIIVNPDSTTNYTLDVTDNRGCVAHKETFVEVNELPVFSIADQYICSGGSTTLGGPSGNYAYLWSTGSASRFITIPYGDNSGYSLTVTNRATNCNSVDLFTVTSIEEPEVLFNDTTICQGQSILYVLPEEYMYIWRDGVSDHIKEITPLNDMVYTVGIVDTFNCTSSQSFSVDVLNAPQLDIQDAIICNENTISLSVPFSEGFTYMWFDGQTTTDVTLPIDSLVDGWVRAESINCFVTDSFMIYNEIVEEADLSDLIICSYDSAMVSLPSGYYYSWSTGDTTQSIYVKEQNAGRIFATLRTENECTKSFDFYAAIEDFEVSFTSDSTQIHVGSNLELVASSNATINDNGFKWLIDGETYEGNSIIYKATNEGEYNVFLQAFSENGCFGAEVGNNYITVITFPADTNTSPTDTNSTSIAIAELLSVKIYPNPVSHYLKIDTREYDFDNEISYTLIDLGGKEIIKEKISPASINRIDVSNFKEGYYILQLNLNGFIRTSSIIIEK